MTTYRQNVPEQIWVSPAIYHELLTSLDPFTVHSPVWERQYTGNLINSLVELVGEDDMEYARRTR